MAEAEASGLRPPSMSTEVLKALSNPLRRQVWNTVIRLRYARAADLARHLDQPANSLSFHLRVLAEAGLIEEAPEQARDKRDRVWKATRGALSLGSPADPVHDEALGTAVLAGEVADHQALLARVVAWAARYVTGEDPVERGTLATYNLRLTHERYASLVEEVDAVLGRYRDDEETPSTHTWTLSLVAANDEI